SKNTLKRRLSEAGFKGFRPAVKPRLTASMVQKRYRWAKQFRNWTTEDWERVCFSDESHFEILSNRSAHVFRQVGERFADNCIKRKVKHATKIMVWSVISVKGPGRLYMVEGMMDGHQYERVMERRLLPQVREWFPDGNFVFMHDKAPCHMSKGVTGTLS